MNPTILRIPLRIRLRGGAGSNMPRKPPNTENTPASEFEIRDWHTPLTNVDSLIAAPVAKRNWRRFPLLNL